MTVQNVDQGNFAHDVLITQKKGKKEQPPTSSNTNNNNITENKNAPSDDVVAEKPASGSRSLLTQNPLEITTNLAKVVGAKLWIASIAIWVGAASFMIMHKDECFQNDYFRKLTGYRTFASVLDSGADAEKRAFTLLINFAIVMIFGGCFEFACVTFWTIRGIYRGFFMAEKNLTKRYGKNTWAVITGPDSGQGRRFVFELAARKFNILMIGYGKKCEETREEVLTYLKENNMESVEIRVLSADFRFAAEASFFNPIENAVKDLDVSILVNNVGHRFGWTKFHEMPEEKVNDSIVIGTIVQARMTRMIIPKFVARNEKLAELKSQGKLSTAEFETSALINITAQCICAALGFSLPRGPSISLPYLANYEAANVFGFVHGTSIAREYNGQFDILNVTPGAVLTENTYPALKTIPFACDEVTYVKNIMRHVGNVQGEANCHWGHALSVNILPIAPFMLDKTCENTGYTVAQHYESLYHAGQYGGPAALARKASAESNACTASTHDDVMSTASTDETMPFSPVKQGKSAESAARLRTVAAQ